MEPVTVGTTSAFSYLAKSSLGQEFWPDPVGIGLRILLPVGELHDPERQAHQARPLPSIVGDHEAAA
jgi:hypothetical protein